MNPHASWKWALVVVCGIAPGLLTFSVRAQAEPTNKCQFQVTSLTGGANCNSWVGMCWCGTRYCPSSCNPGSTWFTDPDCGLVQVTEWTMCCDGETPTHPTCAAQP